MRLSGDTSDFSRPGQFVNIKLDGFFLRRPISVCDIKDGTLTLIYKLVGGGTKAMSKLPAGEKLDLLTALGSGFDTSKAPDGAVLIGGGVGCPPMYSLAKALRKEGKSFTVILGFNTADDVFCYDKFAALTERLFITTADGSAGMRGFVTDALRTLDPRPAYLCACGPMPMLRALARENIPGQVSLEERMGCGFGGCMGCTIETTGGPKRVCREGPVFDIAEVVWK